MTCIKSFDLSDSESRPKLRLSIMGAMMSTLLARTRFRVAELKDERAADVQFSNPAKGAAASNMNNAQRLP